MDEKLREAILKSTTLKVIFIVLLLLFLWLVRDVAALLFLAIIVATAVSPVAALLERRRVPRVLGVILIYFVGFAIFTLILYFGLPSLASELRDLSGRFPDYYQRFVGYFTAFEEFSGRYEFAQGFEQAISATAGRLTQFASGFLISVLDILGGIFALIMVIALSFYLALTGDGVKKFLVAISPSVYENYVVDLWARVERKIGRWIRGQLLLALIVGGLVYIGLKIFGIPYALVLAVTAGVLELLPFAGPVIAAVPAVILGFFQSSTLGLIMLVFYTLIQQLENHLIVPQVMKRAVDMHPVTVIIALLAGAKLGGIMGMLIAIPLTVILFELFDDLSGKKKASAA